MALVAAGSYKLSHPDVDVTFVCPEPLLPLTHHYPHIDKAISTKQFNSQGRQYAFYFNITDPCLCYELKTQPNVDLSRIEIFCDYMNVKYNPYALKSKPLMFSFIERIKIRERKIKYKDKFVIGWVTQSYSPLRRLPQSLLQELAIKTSESIPNYLNLILRGKRKAWEDMFWDPEKDAILLDNDIRHVLNMLASCDVVIGSDTGPMHSAAMMGIPTIWLFTHIDGKIRTKEYDKVHVMQGNCPLNIGPCWYDGECDEHITNVSPCSSSFDPTLVFSHIFMSYIHSEKYHP